MKTLNASRKKILSINPYFEMRKHELGFLPFEPLGLQSIPFALENGDQKFLDKVIKKNLNLEYAKKLLNKPAR